jgi:hypothetical protein
MQICAEPRTPLPKGGGAFKFNAPMALHSFTHTRLLLCEGAEAAQTSLERGVKNVILFNGFDKLLHFIAANSSA